MAEATQTSPDTTEADAAAVRTVLAVGLPEAARKRIEEAGDFVVATDPDGVQSIDIALVSTRVARTRALALIDDLRNRAAVLAVAHPGGEEAAVELLAAGAAGIIAEGHEKALVGYLEDADGDAALLEKFQERVSRESGTRRGSPGDRDPVTGLLGPAAFDARLGSINGALPRVAFLRIRGLDDLGRRLSVDAAELLQRRIAVQLEDVARYAKGEMYSLGRGEFAVMSTSASLSEFEEMAQRMVEITAAFSPNRTTPLMLAVGHCGPEATGDLETLLDLARRGLELAYDEHVEAAVVGAEQLAKALASSTELEAANRAVAAAEARDESVPAGHGRRVAMYAAALAEALGVDGREQIKIRMAAQFHDVGKIGMSDAAFGVDPHDPKGEGADEYRTHPQRGATFLKPIAGSAVAELVRAHHEWWDGTGFPDSLAGEDIPLGARIIHVADALDRWSDGASGGVPASDAISKAEEAAGTRFDPGVVEAVRRLFG